jgi:predicted O-methyltransferase YrrM
MTTHKPNCVVECSCGVSTIIIARTLEINGVGHVFSLEHDPVFAEKTRNELKRHSLENYATVINAPLTKIKINNRDWLWYSINSLPEELIDTVVIDGPPAKIQSLARYPALPCLYDKMQKGAAIFLDDFYRPDETEIVNRWTKEFPIFRADFLSAEKGICYLTLKK